MTVESFYPQNSAGYTITYFSNIDQTFPLISLGISFLASSVGMSKWFLRGPFPILPKDSPLNGLISLPFLSMMILNTMFGVRVICIENALFSTYQLQNNDPFGRYVSKKTIAPILPPEYRILVYITPCLLSFIINLIRLLITNANIWQNARKYPQIIMSCCFTPFMFEGCKESNQKIQIWKLGTILNAFFIGCLPQLVLLVMDSYRGVTKWDFMSLALQPEAIIENNDALFKSRYGNTIFSIVSALSFIVLISIFFFTDKIFKHHGIHCRCFTILCCPCPRSCSNLSEQSFPTDASELNPGLPENELDKEESELEEMSLVNEKIDTQIFLYTRKCKLWLKGEPLTNVPISLNEVFVP